MTLRQEKFIDEYLLTGSAMAAGYSVKSARYQGCKLLQNVEVKAEIERRRQIMANEKILTATDLQEFLSSVIRGEVQDEIYLTRLVGKGCSIVEKHKFTAATKDRLRAVELLGKLIGAFDKTEATDATSLLVSTLEKIYKESEVV